MAVEIYLENQSPTEMSPRISFSHDLYVPEGTPSSPKDAPDSNPKDFDFDFCTQRNFEFEPSSADELFSGGRILPMEVNRKSAARPHVARMLNDYEFALADGPRREGELEKSSSRSFWGFRRSSSMNCGGGYERLLCPLPLLSRSNSTGSKGSLKGSKGQNSAKPPLKKGGGVHLYGNGYCNGVRINVSAVNLRCLSSLFGGKEKGGNNKK